MSSTPSESLDVGLSRPCWQPCASKQKGVECLPVVLYLHAHIVKTPNKTSINWQQTSLSYTNTTPLQRDLWWVLISGVHRRRAGVKKPLGEARTSKFASHLNGPPSGGVAHGPPTVNWNAIEIAAQYPDLGSCIFLIKAENVTLLSRKKKNKSLLLFLRMRRPRYKDTNTAVYTKHKSDGKAFFTRRKEPSNIVSGGAEKRSLHYVGRAGMDRIKTEYCLEAQPQCVRCSGDKTRLRWIGRRGWRRRGRTATSESLDGVKLCWCERSGENWGWAEGNEKLKIVSRFWEGTGTSSGYI